MVAALGLVTTTWQYVLLSLLSSLFYLTSLPFQTRRLIALDGTRRVAILSNAVGLIGYSVGPAIGASTTGPPE